MANGKEVHTHDDVLRRTDDGVSVCWAEDVVNRHHQHVRFGLRFERKRKMDCHLIAIEICVVASAHERMDLDRVAFNQHWLERLNTHAVKRGCAVE